MSSERGKFIVLYGPNNIGKSEQIKRLVEGLNEAGITTTNLKYPIYDLEPTGPLLNEILRHGNPDNRSAEEIQALFAQNRFDFEPTLLSLLDKRQWVVGEDYTGTGIAWGLTFGVPMETLTKLNKDLFKEDLAICLDGERFSSGIERGHLHEESGRWESNRRIHQELSKLFGWEIVNANQSREEVASDVMRVVKTRFGLR